MKVRNMVVALVLAALAGCTFAKMSATKSVEVKQGRGAPVTVQADATSVCKDYFVFYRCWLTVDAKEVKQQ